MRMFSDNVAGLSVLSMILPVHTKLRDHITRTLQTLYGIEAGTGPVVALENPPSRELGDLGSPVAFELARRLRKAPKLIAQEIADASSGLDGVPRVSAANGYLNFGLDRHRFATAWATTHTPPPRRDGKAIVEHTAINPNKAAHIGHLRNAALGDTLVRALRFQGTHVEVQNYIDDTGVQVADVVVGFRVLESLSLDDIRRVAETVTVRSLLLGSVRARHRLVRRRQGPAGDPRGDAARHRARRQRERRGRRVHRRSHRPLPPGDDGAAERRLRPPDLGGRHPAPEVLGARLRRAEGQGRRLPADRRPAGRAAG